MMKIGGFPDKVGLYDPANEKDSCGVGFVANIKSSLGTLEIIEELLTGKCDLSGWLLKLLQLANKAHMRINSIGRICHLP